MANANLISRLHKDSLRSGTGKLSFWSPEAEAAHFPACYLQTIMFEFLVMITIEFSLKQLMDAVKKLSPSEKLELNEMIWAEDISIPMEHQDLINKRIQKSKDNPEELLDWDIASKPLLPK